MYCSNCGTFIKGNFCSQCGTKVDVVNQDTNQEIITPHTLKQTRSKNDTLLIKSENCDSLIEEKKKASDKETSSYLTTVNVIAIIIMFSPYLFTALDNKKLSQAEGPSLPIVFLVIAMLIVAWIFVLKQNKASNELYNKYKKYCSTEVLIADEAKIYGSTTKGTITLTYEQIESVRFSPNVWSPSKRKTIISNDIFTIRDVAGNEFVFYSFSNCKELKTVIDMQIRSIQDDNV